MVSIRGRYVISGCIQTQDRRMQVTIVWILMGVMMVGSARLMVMEARLRVICTLRMVVIKGAMMRDGVSFLPTAAKKIQYETLSSKYLPPYQAKLGANMKILQSVLHNDRFLCYG